MPDIQTTYIVWAVIGYLFGSVAGGMILARLMGLGNLREIGSGNIGATNVLRTGNKTAAALTLLFDAGKAIVVILLARHFAGEIAAQVAALAAFIGHCFPIWLRFNGGKGVATYFGILLALSWPIGLIACAIWLIVAAVSRYSSLAALMTAGWIPIVMAFTDLGNFFLLAVILGILVYLRHWGNIRRLRAKTETKIGAKEKS